MQLLESCEPLLQETPATWAYGRQTGSATRVLLNPPLESLLSLLIRRALLLNTWYNSPLLPLANMLLHSIQKNLVLDLRCSPVAKL